MNIDEQEFQKRLAVWQILATLVGTVGAVIFASGVSLLFLGSGLGIDAIAASDETTRQTLESLANNFSNKGSSYIIYGACLLCGGPSMMILVIKKDKMRHKTD